MKVGTVTVGVAVVLLFATGERVHALQQGTFVQFDVPGSATEVSPACSYYCGTQPSAVNNAGVIVGYYTDQQVVPHGFLRTPDGKYISFDAPGAGLGAGLNEGTVAIAINNSGTVAGQYEDSELVVHGFLRYPNGAFVTLDAPGAGTAPNTGTIATSVNDSGTTAGYFIDNEGTGHGFVRLANRTFTTFDPPGSAFTVVGQPNCLNESGALTGYYWDQDFVAFHGFVREPDGSIVAFDAPGTMGFTLPNGINNQGSVSGWGRDNSFNFYGFERNKSRNFTMIHPPNAGIGPGQDEIVIGTINDEGAVPGYYVDDKWAIHGFETTRSGSYRLFGVQPPPGTSGFANNAKGEVTGIWFDSLALNHGFLWIPNQN